MIVARQALDRRPDPGPLLSPAVPNLHLHMVIAMQAISFPLFSRYAGADSFDLRILRSQETWIAYWMALERPELIADVPAWRAATELPARRFRRARLTLEERSFVADGRLLAIPASPYLTVDTNPVARRLEMAWALYGPMSRRRRAQVTGIGYNSKDLSRDPGTPAPDADAALDWIGRTCARGRYWSRCRLSEGLPATVLAWRPIWHVMRRSLKKSNGWLVSALRNRNLPHLDVQSIPEWSLELVQLPLPFPEGIAKVTPGDQQSDSQGISKVTPGDQQSDGFTAPVNGMVNPPPVKDGEESSAGESSASGGMVFSRDYLRRLGLSDRQIEYQLQQGDA